MVYLAEGLAYYYNSTESIYGATQGTNGEDLGSIADRTMAIFFNTMSDTNYLNDTNTFNNEIISKSGVEDNSQRILSFRQGSYEVLLALNESSLITDSDFKEDLLESVSTALMRRLEQLQLH